jgi:hypothetical protein
MRGRHGPADGTAYGSTSEDERMRGRALRDWVADLVAGDPVALGIAGFFLLLLLIVAVIWLVDRVKRHKEDQKKQKRMERMQRRRQK